MAFREILLENLDVNPFNAIGKDWFLITAGNEEKINTMTASFGHFGHIWKHDTVIVYIRPQRYTKQFVDEQKEFSLSFFNGKYKPELTVLGRVSGKDANKIKDVNFTPVFIDGVPTFEEAELVFIVEKIYTDNIKPENFLDSNIDGNIYPKKDYHIMYIAKIKKVLVKE